LIGRNWLQFLPQRDRTAARAKFENLRPDAPRITYQHRVIAPDGIPRWQEWTDLAVFDEQGRPVEYHATGWDITTRVQIEKALRKSEERLRAIFQASADPMVVYDLRGTPLYVNPAFSRLFGWTLKELQEQQIDFVPEEQRAATERTIRELYETGRPVSLETQRLCKDGRIVDIRMSAALIHGGRGKSEGMVVNLTDITARKRLESQFQQARNRHRGP
jgi:two-component system, cell cycle sensor histidine kinase and response regulator CckA